MSCTWKEITNRERRRSPGVCRRLCPAAECLSYTVSPEDWRRRCLRLATYPYLGRQQGPHSIYAKDSCGIMPGPVVGTLRDSRAYTQCGGSRLIAYHATLWRRWCGCYPLHAYYRNIQSTL